MEHSEYPSVNLPSGEYAVDRFEGDYAVCESASDRKMHIIHISKLPSNLKEGSIIRISAPTAESAPMNVEIISATGSIALNSCSENIKKLLNEMFDEWLIH